MIIGVIGFYFVVSAITSYISDSINKTSNFAIRIENLRKLRKKYRLSDDLYRIGMASLIKNDISKDRSNFTEMLGKFPKTLKRELKYQMYSSLLKNFPVFKNLRMKMLNTIGDHLKKVQIKESRVE